MRSARHGIRVADVETVAPGVVSIHLAGRDLDRLQTAGGQYAIWRFWSGATWWHAHPISFSAVPTATNARITVRDLGRGSACLCARSDAEPGCRSRAPTASSPTRTARLRGWPSSPRESESRPIRSLLEGSSLGPGEATVLLRGTDESQRYLWNEIGELPSMRDNSVYTMMGSRPAGLATWMSAEALARGVTLQTVFPELRQSDLYVCGPQAWTELVVRDARATGLPEAQIHVERFDW